jgi:hypothetical protein
VGGRGRGQEAAGGTGPACLTATSSSPTRRSGGDRGGFSQGQTQLSQPVGGTRKQAAEGLAASLSGLYPLNLPAPLPPPPKGRRRRRVVPHRRHRHAHAQRRPQDRRPQEEHLQAQPGAGGPAFLPFSASVTPCPPRRRLLARPVRGPPHALPPTPNVILNRTTPPPRLPPPPTPPPLPLPQGEYIAVEKLEATYMKASPVEQVGDPRGWSRGSCRGLRAGRGGGARRGWQRCGRKCAVQQRG